jgi:uncharacterized membrane protein (DUF4010 family)
VADAPVPYFDFAIALMIGAIVGIEREKTLKDKAGIGGIRTFVLFAEAGAVGGWLSLRVGSPWILAATVAAVAAAIVAGYVAQTRSDPAAQGLTTEIAAIVVCLLGAAAATGHREIAGALGISTSALLAFKGRIHGVVAKIGEDDLYAVLKLLLATFVVLPLLPDRTIDPWDTINPRTTWWLVILISGLSLLGYAAVRIVGPKHGFALTGLFGGLVSSTAVTLSFARRSKEEAGSPALAGPLAAGVLVAWAIMFVRVGVTVAVVHRPLLATLWAPMAAMAAAASIAAFVQMQRIRGPVAAADVPLRNPFSIASAARFALLFAAVLLVVKLLQTYAPGHGLLALAAIAGMTDVDAITLSMADLAAKGGDSSTAATAIVIAAVSNTLVKCGMTVGIGAPALRGRMLVSTAALLAAGVAALVLA